MNKIIYTILCFGLFISNVFAEGGLNTPLRGKDLIKDTSFVNYTKGKKIIEVEKIERSFEKEPPLIPHETGGKSLVTIRKNECLKCHSKKGSRKHETIEVSETHYINQRTGKKTSKVSSTRYFCLQCHVVQYNIGPLLKNNFKSLN